tara:strand:+ start:1264 stop:1410 length:147 start_codon:yes stop_codon:yes gene_type:complete
MGVPRIELGNHPSQGCSLPLAYTPLNMNIKQPLKTHFLSSIHEITKKN